MTPSNSPRRFPLVCLAAATAFLLRGRIQRESRYLGRPVVMPDGQRFTVFRHVVLRSPATRGTADMPVMVVRFRFARGSMTVNRWLSLLPVPFIVGFPGFREKIWMADPGTGYWQGVYQWESDQFAEAYQHSLVLAIMNRRAAKGTVSYRVVAHGRLSDYISAHEAV